MSYIYNATPAYEIPNQKNKENVEQAMSSTSRESEYKAKMSVSYAAAEREYKDGHIQEGDKFCEEGKEAAEQAKKEVGSEAMKKYDEYDKRASQEYSKKDPDMQKVKEYQEKRDRALIDAQRKMDKIDESRAKAEEQAKSKKECMSKTR